MQPTSYRKDAVSGCRPMLPRAPYEEEGASHQQRREVERAALVMWVDALFPHIVGKQGNSVEAAAESRLRILLGHDNDLGVQRCIVARSSEDSARRAAAAVVNAGDASTAGTIARRWVEDATIASMSSSCAEAPTAFHAALLRRTLAAAAVAGWDVAADASSLTPDVVTALRRVASSEATAENATALLGIGALEAGIDALPRGLAQNSLTAAIAAHGSDLRMRSAAIRLFVAAQLLISQWRACVDVAVDRVAELVAVESALLAVNDAEFKLASVVIEAVLSMSVPAEPSRPFPSESTSVIVTFVSRLCGNKACGATFSRAVARTLDAVFACTVLQLPDTAGAALRDVALLDILPRLISQFGYEWTFAAWSSDASAKRKQDPSDAAALQDRYERFMGALVGTLAWRFTFPERLLAILPPSAAKFVPVTSSHSAVHGEASDDMTGLEMKAQYAVDKMLAPIPFPRVADIVSRMTDLLRSAARPSSAEIHDQLMLAVDAHPYVLAIRSGHVRSVQQRPVALREAARARFAFGVIFAATLNAAHLGGHTVCSLHRDLFRRVQRVLDSLVLAIGSVAAEALDNVGFFDEDDTPLSRSPASHTLACLVRDAPFSLPRRVLWELIELQTSVDATGAVLSSLLRASDWVAMLRFSVDAINERRDTRGCVIAKTFWLRELLRRLLEVTVDGIVLVAGRVAQSDGATLPFDVVLDSSQLISGVLELAAEGLSEGDGNAASRWFSAELTAKYAHFCQRTKVEVVEAASTLRALAIDTRRCVTQQQIADVLAAHVAMQASL